MTTNEHDWTFNANERMDLYEKILQYYVKDNINLDYPDDTLNPWTFMGSLFYCFSVITTIGKLSSFGIQQIASILTRF